MKRTAPIVFCAAFVLASCAGTKIIRPMSNCGHGSCKAIVTATGCNKSQITVTPDPIVVDPGYRGPIRWELENSPGFSFTDNGIDIIQGADNEFDGKLKESGKKFKWNNKHNQVKDYKYDINVSPDGRPGIVCTKDPTIMN